MDSGRDRITELESKVEELQATVRGLTEELVDANERLRALEADAEDAGTTETVTETGTRGEEAKSPESKDGDNDTDESTIGDDIIVA